jgi:acyl-[acyl-carrier-protein]-phospholipid O-acyltransferase/long-chain-fatty-acid--[acyl-carrier-protein] ligase
MADVEMAGLKQIRNKDGTIGHPLPGVACKVVHPESGEPLAEDTDGLLLVTGPNVMRGYLGREKQTAEVLRDGWYVTGDIGRIDNDGFITLTGRQSRFAKIAGEMVPLERLEEEIHAAMETADRFVAVTAIPDPKRGERLVVLNVTLPEGWTAERIVKALGERGLPNLWVPGPRDFFPVDSMPILGTGKLDLQKLNQVAAELAK